MQVNRAALLRHGNHIRGMFGMCEQRHDHRFMGIAELRVVLEVK